MEALDCGHVGALDDESASKEKSKSGAFHYLPEQVSAKKLMQA